MHELLDVAAGADLVVVLDVVAQDAALIRTSWIQWMNSFRPPGSSPVRVNGAAPGEDEHGNATAHRVADRAAEILGAHVDVDDDGLRLPVTLA